MIWEKNENKRQIFFFIISDTFTETTNIQT